MIPFMVLDPLHRVRYLKSTVFQIQMILPEIYGLLTIRKIRRLTPEEKDRLGQLHADLVLHMKDYERLNGSGIEGYMAFF